MTCSCSGRSQPIKTTNQELKTMTPSVGCAKPVFYGLVTKYPTNNPIDWRIKRLDSH